MPFVKRQPNATAPSITFDAADSHRRRIDPAPTSVTAFIGRTLYGPTNEPTAVRSFPEFQNQFGGIWPQSQLGFAIRHFFLNGGTKALIVRLHHHATKAVLTLPSNEATDEPGIQLEAANEGAWGNRLEATVDYDISPEVADASRRFNLTLARLPDPTASEAPLIERHTNLSTAPEDTRFLPRILSVSSQLARVRSIAPNATRPTLGSDPTAPSDEPTPVLGTGGSDGQTLTEDDFIGSGTEAQSKGLYALANTDLFNLLNIPPYANEGQDVDASVRTAATELCERRRAFHLMDPPSTWTTHEDAVAHHQELTGTGRNAAVFFPRIRLQRGPQDATPDTFPPAGAVAGVFARTDADRGVWKAPAGMRAGLRGVTELSATVHDDENAALNELGINCLRSFPKNGCFIWGVRTLVGTPSGASEWQYIPVRRMALFLEESILHGTRWAVFEPNTPRLWAQLADSINAFLHSLFQLGAFQGETPWEAYFVKCDHETTSREDVAAGRVQIQLGFAPLKPGEYVLLHLQLRSASDEDK